MSTWSGAGAAPVPSGDLARYVRLLGAMILQAPHFAPEVEDEHTIQVERGLGLAAAVNNPHVDLASYFDRLDQVDPRTVRVVDRLGHRRPMYPALLVYCRVLAMRLAGRDLDPLHRWCEHLMRQIESYTMPAGDLPASDGAKVAACAWGALALWSAGTPWRDRGEALLNGLCARQQADGGFLRAGASDNPETRWFHELVLLQAIGSHAMRSGSAPARQAACRNAVLHLNETQPDHATGQPWGISGFLLEPSTHMLADQLLHTAQTLNPRGVDGVSLMLLADCLYSLTRASGRRSADADARP